MEYLKFSCLCSPLGLLWCCEEGRGSKGHMDKAKGELDQGWEGGMGGDGGSGGEKMETTIL